MIFKKLYVLFKSQNFISRKVFLWTNICIMEQVNLYNNKNDFQYINPTLSQSLNNKWLV